jgi:hypothetical protein
MFHCYWKIKVWLPRSYRIRNVAYRTCLLRQQALSGVENVAGYKNWVTVISLYLLSCRYELSWASWGHTGSGCRMTMVCAKSWKFAEKLIDRPQNVNVKCYYSPSNRGRHVETLAVTQVVKLLRGLSGTGRLMIVFIAGTLLCQLNSACTVTRYFFVTF